MKNPKVSIIIPAYNMASTLETAIESTLSQSFINFELIVVDDESTDNTRDIVSKFLKEGVKEDSRVSYIFQKNKGRGGALNTGIKNSKGLYITFLDADDTLSENSLKTRVNALDENLRVGMVYADAYYTDRRQRIYKKRKSRSFKNSKDLLNNLLSCPTSPIIGPSIMVRREVLENVGLYKTVYRRNQDQEMHIRILSFYNVLYLPESVLYYRTYLRESKIFKYKLNSIKSWYLIIDNYVKNGGCRLLLKLERTISELLKLFYEFIFFKK